jgi:hypothetical protein
MLFQTRASSILTRLFVHRAELPTCHGPDNQEWLVTRRDRIRKRRVRQLVRQILLARVETYERSAFLRDVVANRPAQHGIGRLEGVEDRPLRDAALDVDRDFAIHAREVPQVRRKLDSNHPLRSPVH